MKKKKQSRPKRTPVYRDSSSSAGEEEEIPSDFGNTSSSEHSSPDNSDLEEKPNDLGDENGNNFGNTTVEPKSPKKIPLIQDIIGVKETEDSPENDSENDSQLYYIKWTGKSYIHCTYLSKADLMEISGGPEAFKKYSIKTRKSDASLSQSLSIPNLMTLDTNEVNANWFEVDRIIGKRDTDQQYYVKWRGQSYEDSTWENAEDIPSKTAIKKFESRQNIRNSTKIADNRRSVDPKSFVELEDPLSDSEGNTLRDYQVEGFNWLRYCWYNSNNSILADEMGLGKTLQIVSTLHDIYSNHKINGPFCVIAPLSTLPHWKNEFERWTKMNAIIYHGTTAAKDIIQHYEMFDYDPESGLKNPNYVKFDVLITNYETFMSDFAIFKDIEWHYLVLDEGHRLKNHTGKCYKLLLQLKCEHTTLLTGTPVQNNVEELWSLLHFLHPKRFDDLSAFLERFGVIEEAAQITQLQDLIKPYLLRRKKSDVDSSIAAKEETIIEVELTRIQKTYYRAMLHENAGTLLQQITGGALPSLLNLMMQLRKVCNHPYLIKGATDSIESQIAQKLNKSVHDEDVILKSIVESSGKLILINKLLPKLRSGGHKVLIFSQMVKVLDILEDYLGMIGIKPERIDGSIPENDRQNAIERFATDPNAFVFLLCTRAGGVGINLTAADTVIIYDSDWNPQNDIQAESRCHRIGQKAKVKVYRLVTRNTYELQMLDRASKKLGLDHAILDGGEIGNKQNPMAAKELESLLRSGVYKLAEDDDEIDKFCEADIDQILVSRTKSFTRDEIAGGESTFAKAKFNIGEENLDLNAKDFWALALPSLKLEKNDVLAERRCKQKPLKFSESDDEDSANKKKRQFIGISTPRSVAAKIMHSGYKGTIIEKALILYSANEEQLAEEDVKLLKRILNVESLSEKNDELLKAEKRFSPSLEEFTDKKETLLKRTFFFYQLNQVMTYLQGPIEKWPITDSGANPLVDYAILFGILKNGMGQLTSVMKGVSVDAQLPQLSDKMIQKIGRTIVMAFFHDTESIDHFSKSYLEPNDWKEAHQELFNRSTLTDIEFQTLFQTVALTGFIEKDGEDDNEVDWSTIRKYSCLDCVSIEAIAESGLVLQKLSRDELDRDDLDEIYVKLGSFGNKIWVSKMRTSIRDIHKCRSFLKRIGDKEKEKIEKMRLWDSAPSWWNSEHDLALVKAIGDFGLIYVTSWILDNDRPFSKYIPESSLEDFQKAAETEKVKYRPQRPREPGDFAFLYNDKTRISRVNVLIQFVDSQTHEKSRRKEILNDNLDSSSSFNDSNLQDPNNITEIPTMPLELSPQMTVLDLGSFLSSSDIYPVGYKISRQYFSLKNPNDKTWYEAWTKVNDGGNFRYVIKHMSEPEMEFEEHTASGVWEDVIREIQEAKGRLGLPKRKFISVSGPFMYGFSNPKVTQCFKLMKTQMEDDEQ